MSFLALDIGNTRLKWAQYEAARPGAQLLAHGAEFLDVHRRLTVDGRARPTGDQRKKAREVGRAPMRFVTSVTVPFDHAVLARRLASGVVPWRRVGSARSWQ